MPEHGYRPDIDGLRAIAVLSVVLYHAGFGMPGGYVGVDVFFVISGFLITGLITREQESGAFSLRDFYLRRLRRIAPASVCMSLVVLTAGPFLMFPGALRELAESATAQQLMCSNFYFWSHGGYFDGPAEFKPLLHTWSLAVEEQFYLIFPFLLVVTRGRRRLRIGILAAATVASLVGSEFLLQGYASTSFYLLPFRAWELFLGSILALRAAPEGLSSWHRSMIAALGVAAIVGSSLLYGPSTPFPGICAIPPCAGAAAVVWLAPRTAVGSFLSCWPMVTIGLMSYSLYLWHWPIIVFTRYIGGEHPPAHLRLAAVLASLVISYASWKFIETPFRRRGFIAPRRQVGLAAAGLASVIVLVSVCNGMASGAVLRWRLQIDSLDIISIGDTSANKQPRFLLWGDSHARSVSQLCDAMALERGLRGACAFHSGMAPLLGVTNKSRETPRRNDQLEWSQRVVDFAIRQHVSDVILCARWECKLNGTLRDSPKDPPQSLAQENARRVFESGLRRTVNTLSRAGIRVWFLRQVPVQHDDPPGRMENAHVTLEGGKHPLGVARTEYNEQQASVDCVLKNISPQVISVIGPGPNWFDRNENSRITDGKRSFYFDADHLSVDGAEEFMRPLLEPVFDRMASP